MTLAMRPLITKEAKRTRFTRTPPRNAAVSLVPLGPGEDDHDDRRDDHQDEHDVREHAGGFRRDGLQDRRRLAGDVGAGRVHVDPALDDERHGQRDDEGRKLHIGRQEAVCGSDDEADGQGHEDGHPEIAIQTVHDARGQDRRQGRRIAHRQVQAAPAAGHHDHLAESEEGDEAGHLDGEEDLAEAQEVGYRQLAEDEKKDDEQEGDDELFLLVRGPAESGKGDRCSVHTSPPFRVMDFLL
jgi:hypothetical protein